MLRRMKLLSHCIGGVLGPWRGSRIDILLDRRVRRAVDLLIQAAIKLVNSPRIADSLLYCSTVSNNNACKLSGRNCAKNSDT